MFHALAAQLTARMPFAPGDPTAPVQGPPLPTVTVTAPTVPAPTVTVTAPPALAPGTGAWGSGALPPGGIKDNGLTGSLVNLEVPQGVQSLLGLIILAAIVVAAAVCVPLVARARGKGALKENAEGSGAVLLPFVTLGIIIFGGLALMWVGGDAVTTFTAR